MSQQTPVPLGDVGVFKGGGIYALYYTGAFPAYELLAHANNGVSYSHPIYVGKAVPAGSRKGIAIATTTNTRQLSLRLREHARSVQEVTNLNVSDFAVRYLIVEPIWIPLGESLLLARHAPVWNAIVEGFGNHDPGKGRGKGVRPMWDTLHPGRPWAKKYPKRLQSAAAIERDASEYLRQRLQF